MTPAEWVKLGMSPERAEEIVAIVARADAEDPRLTEAEVDALRDFEDVVDHLTITAEELRGRADNLEEVDVDAGSVRSLAVRARREIVRLRKAERGACQAMREGLAAIDRLERVSRAMASDMDDLMEAAQQAAVVVISRGDRFAAIRQSKRGGQVELPGGKVEAGEDPGRAAQRGAEEELGVPVTGMLLHDTIGVLVTVPDTRIGRFLHVVGGALWCCNAYAASLAGPEPVGGAEGPAAWATREELLAGSFGPVIAKILAAYDALMPREPAPAEVSRNFDADGRAVEDAAPQEHG